MLRGSNASRTCDVSYVPWICAYAFSCVGVLVEPCGGSEWAVWAERRMVYGRGWAAPRCAGPTSGTGVLEGCSEAA